jgi:hypothetical protein
MEQNLDIYSKKIKSFIKRNHHTHMLYSCVCLRVEVLRVRLLFDPCAN